MQYNGNNIAKFQINQQHIVPEQALDCRPILKLSQLVQLLLIFCDYLLLQAKWKQEHIQMI